MISFRYHVVSLVACLLALAAGIALGSTILQADDSTTEETATAVDAESGGAGDTYREAFIESVAPDLTQGVLDRRTVAVIRLPGATPASVEALEAGIVAAGGSVTARVDVMPELLDVGNKPLVDSLSEQLADDTGASASDGATGYDLLGELLARAVTTSERRGAAPSAAGRDILLGLGTAGLIADDPVVDRLAELVLVVGATPNPVEEIAQGTAAVTAALAEKLDAVSAGVVVAGPSSAGSSAGMLAGVRGDVGAAETVSTVESVEESAGVLAAVLALAEQAEGGVGQYGVGEGATGVRP